MIIKDSADQVDNRIYEIGFHIVSSIPEEKLPAEMAVIKELLEKNGAVFISEELPKLKHLTYKMTKVVGARHLKFDTAYFGWVKFEMDPGKVEVVEKALKLSDTILRFLIIKTVRESTMSVLKPAYRPTEAKPIPGIDVKSDLSVKPPVSEAELDKTIDALMVE